MAAVLAVLGFVAVLVVGAILELAIERAVGVEDIEVIVRRRGARREVR